MSPYEWNIIYVAVLGWKWPKGQKNKRRFQIQNETAHQQNKGFKKAIWDKIVVLIQRNTTSFLILHPCFNPQDGAK